jgi:hypothetical protein
MRQGSWLRDFEVPLQVSLRKKAYHEAYVQLRTPKLLTKRYRYKFDLPPIVQQELGNYTIKGTNNGRPNKRNVSEQLMELRVHVERYTINRAKFETFWRNARYEEEFPAYYGGYYRGFRINKALEHFVSLELMNLLQNQIYIDVASSISIAPTIFSRLTGVQVYMQDLEYPEGIHGNMIGGDAAAMPIPDNFAHAMALHCSFEHFEGDADSRFIREAERVLKPGGVLCIVPLYVVEDYMVYTDPIIAQGEHVVFDSGALICAIPGWSLRHGRMYSPEQFVQRVVKNLGNLQLTVYEVTNNHEIAPDTYVDYVGVFRKPF